MKKPQKVECTFTIIEQENGALDLVASIPDGSENTVAGQLARTILQVAREIMDEATGQSPPLVQGLSQ